MNTLGRSDLEYTKSQLLGQDGWLNRVLGRFHRAKLPAK